MTIIKLNVRIMKNIKNRTARDNHENNENIKIRSENYGTHDNNYNFN